MMLSNSSFSRCSKCSSFKGSDNLVSPAGEVSHHHDEETHWVEELHNFKHKLPGMLSN